MEEKEEDLMKIYFLHILRINVMVRHPIENIYLKKVEFLPECSIKQFHRQNITSKTANKQRDDGGEPW